MTDDYFDSPEPDTNSESDSYSPYTEFYSWVDSNDHMVNFSGYANLADSHGLITISNSGAGHEYGLYSSLYDFSASRTVSNLLSESGRKKPKSVNIPRKNGTLPLPLGLEYTFHSDDPDGDVIKMSDMLGLNLAETCVYNDGRVYNDCGMVEVCSPVHKSIRKLFSFYRNVALSANKLGLKSWSKINGGGGLHINVGIDTNQESFSDFYHNIVAMFVIHPEINWVMNEPSDDHTANWLANDEIVDMLSSADFDINSRLGGKRYSINVKEPDHFEIRCFEMPRSREELRMSVDLVNAIIKRARDLCDSGIKIDVVGEIGADENRRRKFLRNRWDRATRSFNNFLKELGIDHAPYNKLIRRNLYERKKTYGYSHMV